MRKRKRQRGKKTKLTSVDKGRIVEQIVARMHDLPGVKVETNVRLPSLDEEGRKREIDVLLSSQLAGYSVKMAIECKNERSPIGVEKIDAFVGKLQDVGIPVHHGIYVSASGYTGGAIKRARKAGIRVLTLQGITAEGLVNSIAQAFQSVVYLLLDLIAIKITNKVRSSPHSWQMLVFYDEKGDVCGTVPDLVWHKWSTNQLPSSIGKHEVTLDVPSGWLQIVDGKVEPVISLSVQLRVLGLVVTFVGEVEQYALVDAQTKRPEKFQVNVAFNAPQASLPVAFFQTEEELRDFLRRPETVSVTIGRIRLPRIRVGPTYWPPSERALQKVTELMRAFERGEIPDPRPINIAEIEGTDLQTIWEPIWPEHPFVKKYVRKSKG